MRYRFGADLYKRITHVIGVSWEIRNAHILAEDRGAVICSNHQSMLDALGNVQTLCEYFLFRDHSVLRLIIQVKT